MISILLIILKIIGITLLVIVGLILLLLLLVLFVPVRYRLKGSYDEKFLCKGQVTWLLHLVSIRMDVEEKVVTSIKILGIPLSFFMKKKKKVEKDVADKNGNSDEKSDIGNDKEDNKITEVITEEIPEQTKKDAATETTTEVTDEVVAADEGKGVESDNAYDKSHKQSLTDKIAVKVQALFQKVKDLIDKLKDIMNKIKEIILNIKEKKDMLKRYLKILQSDTTKAAFSVCKKRIFGMLKHIFPNKVRANITYGMSDPADTGYILAVYGMLPTYVGKSIILHPNFDEQILKGDFYIKGAIRTGTLLYQVLRVLLDKNCRKLYRIVKKEISNERK